MLSIDKKEYIYLIAIIGLLACTIILSLYTFNLTRLYNEKAGDCKTALTGLADYCGCDLNEFLAPPINDFNIIYEGILQDKPSYTAKGGN